MKKFILSAAIILSSLFASAQTKVLSQTYTFDVKGQKYTTSFDITKDTLVIDYLYQNTNGLYPVFKTKRNAYYAIITKKDGGQYKKYITDRFRK